MAKCGIYKIENLTTHEIYVGQSVNLENRKRRHKNAPNDEKHQERLYQDMREQGIDNFSFEILEYCSRRQLNAREKYWVAYYNAYENGYNNTPGGDARTKWKHGNKLTKKQVKEIQELLATTSRGNLDIANEYSVSENIVSGINTGYYWFTDKITYPIRPRTVSTTRQAVQRKHKKALFAGEEPKVVREVYAKEEHFCSKCGTKLAGKTKTGLCHKCACETHRVVERPSAEELFQLLKDNNGNFSLIARMYGITDNNIRKWCKSYGIPFHSKDYQEPKEEKLKQLPTQPKPVAKLDLVTDEVLEVYPSIEEAQRVNHIFHIGQVCSRQRSSAGGFRWRYIDEIPS